MKLSEFSREEYSLWLNKLNFQPDGLLPAIVQDYYSRDVLMLAYVNEKALENIWETKEMWYYSRKRQELWHKGETSGNIQKVVDFFYDCDQDSLLFLVEQVGVACHTGAWSCFLANEDQIFPTPKLNHFDHTIFTLANIIKERAEKRPVGSYTTYLFNSGLDKILKKVGEEASEVIIAAKNQNIDELIYEIADLIYHLTVLMVFKELTYDKILEELSKRMEKKR